MPTAVKVDDRAPPELASRLPADSLGLSRMFADDLERFESGFFAV